MFLNRYSCMSLPLLFILLPNSIDGRPPEREQGSLYCKPGPKELSKASPCRRRCDVACRCQPVMSTTPTSSTREGAVSASTRGADQINNSFPIVSISPPIHRECSENDYMMPLPEERERRNAMPFECFAANTWIFPIRIPTNALHKTNT